MMNCQVPWVGTYSHLPLSGVGHQAKREPESVSPGMGMNTSQVRVGEVAQAPIHLQPHSDSLIRLQHEVGTILMCGGSLAIARRFVKVLHVHWPYRLM